MTTAPPTPRAHAPFTMADPHRPIASNGPAPARSLTLSDASRMGAAWVLGLTLGTLAGCSDPPPPPAAPEVVRPAVIYTVGAAGPTEKLRFAGLLRAARRAELSFNVPGFVTEFTLTEGSRVRKGQVVARLDDSVFQARVNAARSEFERAQADLGRYQRLWETEQAVARSEVDDRKARLETARTNLAAAEQDLRDTFIRAPFDGVLTRRRLETFTSVQAKQAIADLQDPRTLEVVIQVPQRLLRDGNRDARALAYFEGHEGRPLPMTLKSFSTEADAQTQTYTVVFTLSERPADMTLLPGMPVTVQPFAAPQAVARAASGSAAVPAIPLTAVVSDTGSETFVWVVGPEGRVSRRTVVPGPLNGDRLTVTQGLSAGERIVSAGVSALREGQRVRPLDTP